MIGGTQLFAFSSYTKGRYSVTAVQKSEENYIIDVALPINFKEKLIKKKQHFGELYLEIDGVPAIIIEQMEQSDQLLIRSKIAATLFESTTVNSLKVNDKVSIGLQSLNDARYLVENQPIGRAKLVGFQLAPGHDYTQELTFETSLNLGNLVANSQWLGLNGSGFFIQNCRTVNGKIEFKIHIGQATREKTVFGTPDMQVGQEFNLSAAFTEKCAKNNLKI